MYLVSEADFIIDSEHSNAHDKAKKRAEEPGPDLGLNPSSSYKQACE